MRFAILGLIALATACAETHSVRKSSLDCEARHRVELPAGASGPEPVPALRPRPSRNVGTAYACVIVAVDENGRVTDSKLIESDSPEFGQYFLKLASQSRYRPAMREGKPFAHKVVISASIE